MTDTELDQRLIASLDALDRALGGAERTNRRGQPATPGSAPLGRASRALALAGDLLDRAIERSNQLFGVELLPARMRSRWTVSQQRNR